MKPKYLNIICFILLSVLLIFLTRSNIHQIKTKKDLDRKVTALSQEVERLKEESNSVEPTVIDRTIIHKEFYDKDLNISFKYPDNLKVSTGASDTSDRSKAPDGPYKKDYIRIEKDKDTYLMIYFSEFPKEMSSRQLRAFYKDMSKIEMATGEQVVPELSYNSSYVKDRWHTFFYFKFIPLTDNDLQQKEARFMKYGGTYASGTGPSSSSILPISIALTTKDLNQNFMEFENLIGSIEKK